MTGCFRSSSCDMTLFATDRSESEGTHDSPKIGVLIPVRRFAISVNFTNLSLKHNLKRTS